jgi:hypothetical protein
MPILKRPILEGPTGWAAGRTAIPRVRWDGRLLRLREKAYFMGTRQTVGWGEESYQVGQELWWLFLILKSWPIIGRALRLRRDNSGASLDLWVRMEFLGWALPDIEESSQATG